MKYYNIRQLDEQDCAAACLATISMYYGKEVTITKLRDICGTDINGTSLNGLIIGAQALDLEAKAVRCNKDDLFNKNIVFPIIIHGINELGMTHFIVVYKITKKGAIIADPAKNKKKMSIDEFNEFFDGICIFLKPDINYSRGKIKNGSNLMKFIKLLLPQKKLFITCFISSIIMVIFGITSNFFNQILIDEILPNSLRNELLIFFIGFSIISVISIILNAIRQHMLLYLSQKISIPLTLGYFNHILCLPISFYGKRKTGDIITRFQDAGTITSILSSVSLSVILDAFLAIVVGIVLYFMNPKLFIIIVIMVIILTIIMFIYIIPFKKINIIQMEQSSKFNSTLIESLNAFEVIKSNNLEEDRMEKIENDFIDVMKTGFKENIISNSQNILTSLLSTLGNIVVMWIGINSVMDGHLTLGAFMTFLSMVNIFLGPVGRLVSLQLQFQEANIAMKRVSEIIDIDEENLTDVSDKNLFGDISIENLSFKYGTREDAVKNITMNIKKGSKVAIVGESGSGKTTLAKLMLGLYMPSNGNITINDETISDIGLRNLRNRVSYVSQNVQLFSGTIAENIKSLNNTLTKEQLNNLLKITDCDFVYKLPNGIDTYLHEAGSNLSGGEKQRLSICRSMAKKSDILIMDEATSNLDSISEFNIFNNIINSNFDKTIILIAHRLSTIKNCDCIFVLNKGNLVEQGTHQELLDKKGYYYKLWSAQIGNNIDNDKLSILKQNYDGEEIIYE